MKYYVFRDGNDETNLIKKAFDSQEEALVFINSHVQYPGLPWTMLFGREVKLVEKSRVTEWATA